MPKFFGSLCLPVPYQAGPVGMAGSVPAAVCARLSGISGLRRYGHHSVLIKPNVIVTTGGFGEEDGQHCRVRNVHLLSKSAGHWEAVCVTQSVPDKRWGEFPYRWQCKGDNFVLKVKESLVKKCCHGTVMLAVTDT